MKITIYIYDEKKQENFYKKSVAEYQKRLGRYCTISMHLIRKEKQWIKLAEKQQPGYFVVPGDSISSEDFSQMIATWELSGQKDIIFYIGEEVLYNHSFFNSQPSFSISQYTMNPQMSGLILYEQIYRGYRILNNHPYHK